MIEAVSLRQDTLNCIVLSEAVYKVVDFGDVGAADMLAAIVRSFPPALLGIQRVQWAQPHSHHRRALLNSTACFAEGVLELDNPIGSSICFCMHCTLHRHHLCASACPAKAGADARAGASSGDCSWKAGDVFVGTFVRTSAVRGFSLQDGMRVY